MFDGREHRDTFLCTRNVQKKEEFLCDIFRLRIHFTAMYRGALTEQNQSSTHK